MGNRYRIIVDAYNLIFQCGLEGRSRNPAALERARNRLVTELVNYLTESQRLRTAIVFDAKKLPKKVESAVSEQDGLTIIYAVEYEDADALIEQLILKNSAPKQLIVVSSDHRIHKAASRRKATPIDSDVWYESLSKPGNRVLSCRGIKNSASDKSDPEHLKDIDWISEFKLKEPPASNKSDSEGDEEKSTFNPFPPGYADDLLDEPSDEDQ